MHRILTLLCLASVAFAEKTASNGTDTGGGDTGTGGGGDTAPGQGMDMGLILLVVFGFLIFSMFNAARKQKKEQRAKQERIDRLKIGDKVMTVGGICGLVERIGEDSVDLRTGGNEGAVITFSKQALNQVIDEETAAKDQES
ncbi:MAG: preprotein translocase subunit YajC [Planctomycetota bacterium]